MRIPGVGCGWYTGWYTAALTVIIFTSPSKTLNGSEKGVHAGGPAAQKQLLQVSLTLNYPWGRWGVGWAHAGSRAGRDSWQVRRAEACFLTEPPIRSLATRDYKACPSLESIRSLSSLLGCIITFPRSHHQTKLTAKILRIS